MSTKKQSQDKVRYFETLKPLVNVLSGDEIFPSTVSKVGKKLDQKVEKSLNSPIEEEISLRKLLYRRVM